MTHPRTTSATAVAEWVGYLALGVLLDTRLLTAIILARMEWMFGRFMYWISQLA